MMRDRAQHRLANLLLHNVTRNAYAICIGVGTTAFILADYCWGMAAFRPDRDPQLTSLLNDMAMMTGLHLCHVLLGLIIICFVIRNLKTSHPPKISFVETGATYWHMVDVLWLVLFALLYLMR
jgi:nitric oxide reductase NorE protein